LNGGSDGIVDPTPIFSAQLALLEAKPIADQLGSIALFPTIPSKNPPAATAVQDLTDALAKAQGFLANITVCVSGVLFQAFFKFLLNMQCDVWGDYRPREQYRSVRECEPELQYRARGVA
jgi:hypothetical protein